MRGSLVAAFATLLWPTTVLIGQTAPAGNINQPISFEQNVGQTDPQVRYLARSTDSGIFFTPKEIVIARYGGRGTSASVSGLRLSWSGANRNPKISAENVLPGKVNYLTGRNPADWHTNISTYARIRYRELYPGVDAVFYGKKGRMEYDLELQPGASIDSIRFAFDGATAIHVARNGDLILDTPNGEVRQRRPIVFQAGERGHHLLKAAYVIRPDKTVGYHLEGVDPTRKLVIDPTLVYSTYIGSSTADSVNSVAVDGYGRVYATGSTVFGFPTKNAAEGNRLKQDAFVTKFWATGGGLIYSTYLGGDLVDEGTAIAVDRYGNAYVTGYSDGAGFPVTANSFQSPSAGGGDAFVTKLSPSGSSFVYSFLLGGGDFDIAYGLALDSQRRAYIVGYTCSNNPSNFPVKNAYQAISTSQNCANGGGDGFVTRVNASGTGLDYSTYLGGGIYTLGTGIAVDSNYASYVTGYTASPDFPTTAGAFRRTFASSASIMGFVTKFSPDGRTLSYSTFLPGVTGKTAIAVDSSARAYVTGSADSNLPVTPGAFQMTSQGTTDAFVTKFWATGGGLIYSTFLGGSNNEGGGSIAVDSYGYAYITGFTSSPDFPLKSPIQSTFGGLTNGDQADAFVTKLSTNGGSLVFSTYFGGTGTDYGTTIRLDSSGNAYVGGATFSADFPTTSGAYSRTYKGGGSTDGWVAKIHP